MNMRTKVRFCLGLLLVALIAVATNAVSATETAVLQFAHIAHLDTWVEADLLCDGNSLGAHTIQNQGLQWIEYEYEYDVSGCADVTVQFTGVVTQGLGTKIDDVSLSVNGGANELVNGDFANGLDGWDNPDIGTDGVTGGWQWARRPKADAKLDIFGAGANAEPGEPYRLAQTVALP